ncbi:MAG: hypothetical protein ACSLEY_03180 [Candidatus Saccharimonadales bacterium]
MVEYRSSSLGKVESRNGSGRWWTLILSVLLFAVVLVGLAYRYTIVDQITVWQYRPTAEVQSIATKASLSNKGTFYFYASRPEVDGAEAFNVHCQRKEEHSAILGCYDGRQIFIYNVTDDRLKGIREVTAAHEMLHAAWDRLTEGERSHISRLLEEEFKKHSTTELQERMAYYERTQPGERINELHSIIGTEITDLSDELELHYKLYFIERKTVVAKHDAYSKVFKDLENKANTLLIRIENLQKQIENKKVEYEAAMIALEHERAALEKQSASMNRTSQSEVSAYNTRVSAYNQQIQSVRAQYVEITQLIAEHNDKVVEYNQITSNHQKLQDSIDSLKAPQ